MTRPGSYPQELRERAVRLVFEHQEEHPSQWAAITSIAHKFGSRPRRCASGSGALRPMMGCAQADQ
jgi:transposase-like protein